MTDTEADPFIPFQIGVGEVIGWADTERIPESTTPRQLRLMARLAGKPWSSIQVRYAARLRQRRAEQLDHWDQP